MGELINKEAQGDAGMTRREYEEYINKAELAKRLGKTVRTVDSYMASGAIPFYKIGRSVAFKWSEVDAHIQAHYRVRLRGT